MKSPSLVQRLQSTLNITWESTVVFFKVHLEMPAFDALHQSVGRRKKTRALEKQAKYCQCKYKHSTHALKRRIIRTYKDRESTADKIGSSSSFKLLMQKRDTVPHSVVALAETADCQNAKWRDVAVQTRTWIKPTDWAQATSPGGGRPDFLHFRLLRNTILTVQWWRVFFRSVFQIWLC